MLNRGGSFNRLNGSTALDVLLHQPTPACRAPRSPQDRLLAAVVFNDLHVAEFQPGSLLRPEPGSGHEQYVVVQLLARPPPSFLQWILRPSASCFVRLLVLVGREPGPVANLARGFVRLGQIGAPSSTLVGPSSTHTTWSGKTVCPFFQWRSAVGARDIPAPCPQ
jgi:hypothetical protein